MATETKIARVAFMDKGAYSAITEYSKWDFVTTADSTYLYIGESPAIGKPVTDTAYWKCIADGKQATLAAEAAAQAAGTANDAASLADQARLAIETELGEKAAHGYASAPKTLKEVDDEVIQLAGDVKVSVEKPTAQSLSELNARITALEAIITNKIKDRVDVTKEFNVWGKTNLILTGSGAATFAPDFIGQKYIDTTGGNVYVAVGTANAGNWKLV